MNDLYSGSRSPVWSGMPLNGISRIEIIRGPGSAVYGADAYSGVINIVTKTQEEIDGVEVGGRVSSFNTQDSWILYGDQWGKLNVATSLEYHNTKGQQELIEEDAQTQYDRIFGTNASLAPGAVNTQHRNLDARLDLSQGNWQFRAGYQRRRNAGSGAGIAQALDPIGRYTGDRYNTDLTYHNPNLTQYWDVNAQISYFHTKMAPENGQRLFPPGAFRGAYPEGYIGNPGRAEAHTR